MTKTLTDVSKLLQDHDKDSTLLHEGQMHIELNLKTLVTKLGVTPSNTLPLDAPVQLPVSKVVQAVEDETSVGRDLDGDFQMTEEEFDRVLEDCSRAQESR